MDEFNRDIVKSKPLNIGTMFKVQLPPIYTQREKEEKIKKTLGFTFNPRKRLNKVAESCYK